MTLIVPILSQFTSDIIDQDCYEKSGTGCFAVYGVEYKPGKAINQLLKVSTLMDCPLTGFDNAVGDYVREQVLR